MKEWNCGKIPPCYGSLEFAIYEEAKKVNDEWKKTRARHYKLIDKMRAKLMEGGFLDDTHDKVYELNRQMCDLDIPLRNPIKPLSEETAQELIGRWEEIGKEWASKKKEIVESILGNITNEKSNIMEEKKTKKMTKAEAFEYLKGKKVKCYERSNALYCDLVKKITTECGCIYKGFMSPPDVSVFAIHIDDAGYIRHLCTVDADKYNELKREEITTDNILSIEIVDEKKKSEEEEALDKISCLGAQIVDILLCMKGHHHVTITETTVALHDEGMSLFHSDPF